jgi:N-acetyl-anhydromuramyl-L-alanine amidase AmpD
MVSKISWLVLHCSDTPASMDVDITDVWRWHVDERGWRDVGYHFFIKRDGSIQLGRMQNGDAFLDRAEVGAHTRGLNGTSLGICYAGRDGMTPQQEKAALWLLRTHMTLLGLGADSVIGHAEADPKSGKMCPGLDMAVFRGKL